MDALDCPVVLLGRGGSGTRVLSQIAQQMGIFLGNDINVSGDSVEWVRPIYDLSVATCTGGTPDPDWPRRLRDHASDILKTSGWESPRPWGWKLPETMLISKLLERIAFHIISISVRLYSPSPWTMDASGRVTPTMVGAGGMRRRR